MNIIPMVTFPWLTNTCSGPLLILNVEHCVSIVMGMHIGVHFRLLVLSYFVPSPISFSISLPIFNFFCLEHQFYPRRQWNIVGDTEISTVLLIWLTFESLWWPIQSQIEVLKLAFQSNSLLVPYIFVCFYWGNPSETCVKYHHSINHHWHICFNQSIIIQ
jgi:hypothetical protein